MSRAIIAVLFSITLTLAQAPEDPGTGSIEGIVVNSLTNQPVDEAQLTLKPDRGGPNAPARAAIAPVKTGADGKFAFTGLKGGVYRVEMAGNGYVRMHYGQKVLSPQYGSAASIGTPFTLAAGEAVKNLSIRLIPTGTITGRVLDSDTRQPVTGVPVRLGHFVYGPDGERSFEVVGSIAQTNDRGEYRLYFLTPIRYYVQAGGPPDRNIGLPRGGANETTRSYSSVFYPAAVNVSDATIVDLKPGADVGGIDLLLGKAQDLYRISGRILDASTGQPPAAATVSLYRLVDTHGEPVEDAASNYRAADGSFGFGRVSSGDYLVRVEARSTPQRMLQTFPTAPAQPRVVTVAYQAVAPRAPEVRGYAVKDVPVTIGGADVENLSILVSPGVSVNGRIAIEGRRFSEAELNRLRVNITSADRMLRASTIVTVDNGEATFQLNDVSPGEYRASVALPPDTYLKEARFGGADALGYPFQVSDRESAALNLTVSEKVATVEGTVTNEKRDALSDAVVVLVPDRNRDRSELFRNVATDRTGHFVLTNVAPGNYKIIAWDALEPYTYFDPAVLRTVDQRGQAIQLRESARVTVSLTAQPGN